MSGMIPQFGGYGLIPNYAGSMFPTGPGFSSRPNAMGGTDTRLTLARPPQVSPWMPPPLPGQNPPTVTPNMPPGGTTAAPNAMPGRAPAMPNLPGGATGVPPMGAPVPPAGTAGPVAGGATNSTPPQSSPWLSGLLGQITGTPFQPLPNTPNLGLPQGQQNLMAYQTYLQNLANQDNDTRFKQAAMALQGAGQTANTDALQIADQARAGNNQHVMDSGLSNSTILPTLNRGVDKDLSRNQASIQEGIASRLADLLQSKTTTGPDASRFAELMRALSSAPNTSLIPGFGGTGVSYSGFFGPTWSR